MAHAAKRLAAKGRDDVHDIANARLIRRGPARSARLSLRTLREGARLSQEQVSKKSGLAQSEISKLETARTLDDRMVSTLRRYLAAIGADLELAATSKFGHRIGVAGAANGEQPADANDLPRAPIPHDAQRVSAMSRLFDMRHEFETIARTERDRELQVRQIKAITVLDVLVSSMRGDDEALDAVWKAARKWRGASAFADTNKSDMEDLYEGLVPMAENLLNGENFEQVVDTILWWIKIGGVLGPDPESEDWPEIFDAVVKALRSARQRRDAGAIVRACFRACGYTQQLGKRKHVRAERRKSHRRRGVP